MGGTFVATLFALGGAGIVASGELSQAHLEARHPAYADAVTAPVALLKRTYVIVPDGFSQIPVVWISPLPGHEDDPYAIPPGLRALPDPGGAVLSPGLVSAGYAAEDFGFASSEAGLGANGVIGDAGLASASEGFIYVRPRLANTELDGGAAAPTEIAGFGATGETYGAIEASLDVPTRTVAWVGTTWLVFLPALFLLVGSARATSPVRTARARTLFRLGAATSAIRLVAALEAAVLAALGAVPALVVWVAWLQLLRTLPFTDALLIRGAMRTPLGVSLGVVVVALAVAATAGMLGSAHTRQVAQSARRPRVTSVIPLAVSLTAMLIAPESFAWQGGQLPQEFALVLLFGGAIGTFASLPLALPVLTGWIAHGLGFATHVETWLAGRILTVRRLNLARPGVMVGALVFVAGSAFAIITGAMSTQSTWWPDVGDRAVFATRWAGSASAHLDGYGLADDRVALAPTFDLPEVEFEADGVDVIAAEVYFVSCASARDFFAAAAPILECDEGTPDNAGALLGHRIRIGALPDAPATAVLVSAPRDWSQSDVLRALTGRDLVSVNTVSGPSGDFGHPGIDWFATGWASASFLLLCALLRELGDRVVLSAGEARRLERAGATSGEAGDVLTIAAMTPALVAVPVGFVAALLFALRGYGEGITAFNLGELALVSAVVTVLALAVLGGSLRMQRTLRDGP